MNKARLRAATVGGGAGDIEAAFYDALRRGDLDRLMACWGDEDDIVCVQPGGPRWVGAGQIRAGYEALLAPGPLELSVEQVRKVDALASAVHSVLEQQCATGAGAPHGPRTMATNVYHRTAQGWRLVARHASPASAADGQPDGGAAAVLH